MSRRHRLGGRRAFAAVRARRLVGVSGSLRVGVAPNDLGHARIGFAIPSAVGGAVVRNRLRRRLKEALRPELAGVGGLDVVVTTGPAAAALAYAELSAQLRAALAAASSRAARVPGGEDNARLGDNAPQRPRSGRAALAR